MPVLAAETTTTTTTEVPRMVGKYPGEPAVLGSAGVLLAVIVAAGAYMTWRSRRAAGAGPEVDASTDRHHEVTASAAGDPAPKRGGG